MSYRDAGQATMARPRRWLVTGAAGFIGSNLVEALLRLDQQVVGLDNFSTGHQSNLEEIRLSLAPEQWARFRMVTGDVQEPATCLGACQGIDVVLHQAALASVPLSMEHPERIHAANVTGSMNVLNAARETGVSRVVYASSSAVYGDHLGVPAVEPLIGRPLSPYALSKRAVELYADTFSRCYGLDCVGLRYFNAFGRRQDPEGAYAAVIPRWVSQMIRREAVYIHGDGETTRDFCHVAEVVQANLLAATTRNPDASNQIFNIAGGQGTTLNELFLLLRTGLSVHLPHVLACNPVYDAVRAGDVRHSLADIGKAERLLGFCPTLGLAEGLAEAMAWYAQHLGGRPE